MMFPFGHSVKKFTLVVTMIMSCDAFTLETSSEKDVLSKHAASCAAYFFSAARAKEMTEYEVLYGAGEYAFNLAVVSSNEAAALEHFNNASTHINHVMQKRWSDFYKVDEQYASKCEKVLAASKQVPAGQN